MSRVQPPGWPLPFGTPVDANTPGAGHVVSAAEMNASIPNGWFRKSLLKATPFGVTPLHAVASGGDVRFTSFWSRQPYAAPFWSRCVQLAADAFGRPFTPSQSP